MKERHFNAPMPATFVLLIALMACNLPSQPVAGPQPADLQFTLTIQALDTLIAQSLGTPEGTLPDVSGTQASGAETQPSAPAPPTIVHQIYPGEPAGANTWVTDRSTRSQAGARQSDSDIFEINLLERPFTSEVMDYQAHLDLTRVNLHFGALWIYVTFVLEGAPPLDSSAIYALEFDLDSDGRGDWLLLGQVPSGSEWTSDGAQVFYDANNDVGGVTPMGADGPNPSRDGYEQLVFDQGLGSDPDAAWVRRDPGNTNQVQLAMKHDLIANDSEFVFGGWADDGLKNPGAFDYNDFVTLEQAGSPAKVSNRYPIKGLALVDSTCRWAYGYTPLEPIPGLCPLPATPTPTPTATPTATLVPPGSITSGVWKDNNANASRDSGEPGFSGVSVSLGSGACGSSGLATGATGSDGAVRFNNLAPGTYCVSVNIAASCGGWLPSTATQQTVVLGAGENKIIAWFGYSPYVC